MQMTFTDMEYSNRNRTSKREKFLNQMDEIIPWSDWITIIKPYYFKGFRGIEVMLRMYLLQIWFKLSDEGVEDAINDSYSESVNMRKFMGINFVDNQVPNSTTLLHFRHTEKLFQDVNTRLENAGLIMHGGTIVDATIIEAPSSTKNASKKRDEEMHSTKKGNNSRRR